MLGSAPIAEAALAQVALDGIKVEVAHGLAPEALAPELRRFAEELANERFREWGVAIEPRGETGLHLAGGREGTYFEADIQAFAARVTVDIRGRVELGLLKLKLAGGAEGVRRRVGDQIRDALRRHLT